MIAFLHLFLFRSLLHLALFIFLCQQVGKILLDLNPALPYCLHQEQPIWKEKIFLVFDLKSAPPWKISSQLAWIAGHQLQWNLATTPSNRNNQEYIRARVHKNKSRQLHTMGSVTAEFEVRHRWRTTTLFSGCYALNAEHVHARSLQKLHLFDWHFRPGLHFACTCSSKYRVQRWVQRSRINVFPILVQTDVGSDDELRILPWQHS